MVSAEQSDVIVPVVVFDDKEDNQPRPFSVPWLAFAQRLCTYEERLSKDGRAWSPVTYYPGTTRGKANVDRVHMLVLDVDHQALPLDLLGGLEYVAHTTFSHAEDDPRWRVVLPLSEPIEGADWPEFWLRANAHFGGCVDPQTKDSSRIFYLPSCRPGGLHRVEQQHGAFLDPASLPDIPRYDPPSAIVTPLRRRDGGKIQPTYLHGWAERFVETKCSELASMQPSTGRNATCNRIAYLLGGLAGDRQHELDQDWIANSLYAACERNGLVAEDGRRSVEATIRSGLESGLLKAWSPADREEIRPLPSSRTNGHVEQNQPAPPTRPRIWEGPELEAMRFDSQRWAIPRLLPAGLTILAGRPKLGKSWLGLGWGLDIARSTLALRKLQVIQGRTLYLALEDGPRRMQERMAMMLGDAGAPRGFHVATEWRRLNEGGMEDLVDWLTEHPDTRLIVIDTFKRVRPIEKSTQRLYDLDYDAIAPLAELARQHNVAIVLVFHTRKMPSEDPLEMVSGTLGVSGAADAVMVLRRERGQADASLFVTGRDVEEQDLALRWEKDDALGWALLGNAEEFRLSAERRAILDIIEMMPGMTPMEIAEALDKPRGSIRKLLFSMVRDGEVRERDKKYYSLARAREERGNSGNSQSQSVTAVTPPLTSAVTDNTTGVTGAFSVANNTPVTAVTAICRKCGRDWDTHGARDPISCQWEPRP